MKAALRRILEKALERCYRKGLLREAPSPEYTIEIPNNAGHGHFATNLPLTLASIQKKRPRDIALIIADHLGKDDALIERAEVAGPGFINFWIPAGQWYRLLRQIIAQGHEYGRRNLGAEQGVLVEFVSANPTGPLHLGHGRGAALGDTLCRILSFMGYKVTREFYVNDAGAQIRLLGESVFSRCREMQGAPYPFPENGYHGDYVRDLAKSIMSRLDENLAPEEAIGLCAENAKEMMMEELRTDLADFRVSFDSWKSECELHASGLLASVLDVLRKSGGLYEKDGALWIRTSDFGDDKDRVLRKSDGQFTYFASDIAYHLEKRDRGFAKAINVWGADHHGYVPRVQAALAAKGIPSGWLTVLLIQLVKLWKGGQEIKMSKRAGQYVTLRELVDDVGVDAARFVFLTKHHDSPLDFDVDRVKRQDTDNPVFYVQYAHARICSIFRKAEAEMASLPEEAATSLERLVLEEEMALIRAMADFPSLLEDICRTLEPHRLTFYLTDLASLFHKYFNLGNTYAEHRVITEDTETSRARCCLARGVKTVLEVGLGLLGIHAPERM